MIFNVAQETVPDYDAAVRVYEALTVEIVENSSFNFQVSSRPPFFRIRSNRWRVSRASGDVPTGKVLC